MLSDGSDVSSKRVVGFFSFLLFVAVVIFHLITGTIVQNELVYLLVGLITACFGLNAWIDAKALGSNSVKDNPKEKKTSDEPKVIQKPKEVSPIQDKVLSTDEPIIEDADILDGLKEGFKKPLSDIKAKNLLAAGNMYLGTAEVPGSGNNKAILEFAKRADISWYRDDATPWCAVFVNAMCDIVGLKETKSALAKSFLKWGKKITIGEAAKDNTNVVGIFHRGNPNSSNGHVAILKQVSSDGLSAVMLGGNQSDKVCLQNFKLDSKFIEFRRGEYV